MRDGHIHSPYCPHGTRDSFSSYIEHGLELGYKTMTFTEHAPLPESFRDPVPSEDSGMKMDDVEGYISDLKKLQSEYKKDIDIWIGFEMDYIEGFEKEIEQFLNTYGPQMDDSILSVHFLKGQDQWYCLDYSPEMYESLMRDLGSNKLLYQRYFDALTKSVNVDLGAYKPKRIGHMTLVKKFQNLFPSPEGWESSAVELLKKIKSEGLQLDYNGAGTQKPHCKETYPPLKIAEQASAMGIPLIYGSDAHKITGLKQGFQQVNTEILKL
ncbi:histidinol-phosphatase HisJ [Halobacillus mangrovi]|uniref:Histidinol-phosphatase n=1 Tax=Halobacillus mangrovi TaxID=402384 RepID=A0A1W5ZU15_9BACI|nr:histidinol-phosphatase HisJ [Halobacillus mangrovi]ARI76790.1 histidinol phosphatase [Halobacillus mangrovi]